MPKHVRKEYRPRSFWLRGLKICLALLAIGIASLAVMALYASMPD